MAYMERESQAIPIPAQIVGRRRDPFIIPNMVQGGPQRYVNSHQRITEAPVISALKIAPEGFLNYLDLIREWEPSPRPAMESVCISAQDAPVDASSLGPGYGDSDYSVSDYHSPAGHEQVELYPDYFLPQRAEWLNEAQTAPGFPYRHPNELGRNDAEYDLELNALKFQDSMRRPPVNLAAHFPINNSNSLEWEVPVPERFPADCSPGKTMCRHETEVPMVAAALDIPVLLPQPCHTKFLVFNESSPNEAISSKEPRPPMVPEHSKSQTSSGFISVSTPVQRNLDEVNNEERKPTDTSSRNPSTSRQIVWNAKTGDSVAPRTKRKSTKAERHGSRVIRGLGGQCPKCKKEKRKCNPSHIQSTSEASTNSPPLSTHSSLGSSCIQTSSSKQLAVKPSDSSARRYGDHLVPPSPSHRQRVAHTPRLLSVDLHTRPDQELTLYEFEGPVAHACSGTPGSQSTYMLYLDALAGNVDTAMLLGEADSNASSMNGSDITYLS